MMFIIRVDRLGIAPIDHQTPPAGWTERIRPPVSFAHQ